MPDLPVLTRDEATTHYQQVISAHRALHLTEFPTGWLVQEIPTPAEQESGQGIGMGLAIIDKETGTVTSHPSLPPMVISAQYDTQRQQGQITGRQEWPWTTTEAERLIRAILPTPEPSPEQIPDQSPEQAPEPQPLRTIELTDQVWTVTPIPAPGSQSTPRVTYVADGLTCRIWEYPTKTAVGSLYLTEKPNSAISGRQVYPVPT